jgi:hypothetical protein
MQRPGDMPLYHLRAVAQHHQRGDGAQTPGFEVNGGPVVNLAIYHRVNQPHHLRRQFDHGRRRLRVVVRPVVPHTELGCGLVQVGHQVIRLVILVRVFLPVRVFLKVGTIGTEIRIVLFIKSGIHSNALYPGLVHRGLLHRITPAGAEFSRPTISASSGALLS